MITYGSTTLTSYNSIVKTEVYYYKSTSATSLSGGSWSTTKPTWENGKYIWQKIRTIYEDGTHSESDPVNITGQQGATGTAAYSYKLHTSDSIISKTQEGKYTITKVTFSATSKQGSGAVSAYSGRFKIESTTNGSTWKTEYTSGGNESSKEFTIPANIIAIKCSLYQSGGTTVLLDIVTVPVVKDGVNAIGLRDSIPYYLASDKDTGITRLTQGWTRYKPQLTAEKKYLWVYYVSRYSEGSTEPELIEIKDDLVHFENNGDESPVESCVVDIEPVQDLNSYDHPWIGGAGKNLLPCTMTTKTVNGITFTVKEDGTVIANGTASSTVDVSLEYGRVTSLSGNYYFTGCPSGGKSGTYDVYPWDITTNARPKKWDGSTSAASDYGAFTLQQIQIPEGHELKILLRIFKGQTVNNIVFKPMIVKSTETSAAYEPYENICPITGWTAAKVTRRGKNLMGKPTWTTRTQDGVTATLLEDGRVSVTGTGTNTGFAVIFYNSVDLPAGTYIFNGQNNADVNKKLTLQLYNITDDTQIINRDTATDYTFTLDKPSRVTIRIGLRVGIIVTDAIISPMIRHVSSADPTYEPYESRTHTITFPSEAGTVYGGTLDVTNGELVVDRAMVTLDGSSDENWRMSGTGRRFFTDISSIRALIDAPESDRSYSGAITNKYKEINSVQSWNGGTGTIGFAIEPKNSSTTPGRLTVRIQEATESSTTVEDFTATLATEPLQICFPLAAPQTYQLTPQEITMLCKENNLWADTGQTSISYYDNQTSTDPFIDYSATSAFEYSAEALDKIDNLKIGGRNLLLDTGTSITFSDLTIGTSNFTTKDFYKTITPVPKLFAENDIITISFGWSTTATDGSFHVECGKVTPYTWGKVINAINGRSKTSNYVDVTPTNTSGHFIVTFKVTNTQVSAADTLEWLRIRVDGADWAGKSFSMFNAKLERGNKATDWTPAPEDIEDELATMQTNLQTQIDAKIQTYYQSSAPSWPTAERAEHDGDLWYYTGSTTSTYTKGNVYRYNASNNSWVTYSASGELFDKVDGKTTVFYGKTTDTHTGVEKGDYLVDNNDGSSYRYDGSKWVKVTDYQSAIDAVEIGGRNLVVSAPGADWYAVTIEDAQNKNINLFGLNGVHGWLDIPNIPDVKVDDIIQVSFDVKFSSDWKSSGTGTARAYVQGNYNGTSGSWVNIDYHGGNKENDIKAIMNTTSKEGHINTWFKVRADMLDGTHTGIAMSNIRFDYYSGIVYVRHVMVEKGTKPTNWTPAIEDVDESIDKAQTTATTANTKIDNLKKPHLAWKVNYSAYGTSNNGKCYFHGYNSNNAAADVDGKVDWNGAELTITKGMWINPNAVAPYDTVILHIYRTSTEPHHADVWWDNDLGKWRGYMYKTDKTPNSVTDWSWDEVTDCIIATYVEPSSEGAIQSAQLFNPPKKFSELPDPLTGFNFNNMKIGGKNLLVESEYMTSWYKGSGAVLPHEADSYVTLKGSSSDWNSTIWSVTFDMGLLDGVTEYALSFEYNSSINCSFFPVIAATAFPPNTPFPSGRTKYTGFVPSFILPSSGGKWVKYSLTPRTIALSDLTSGSGDINSCFIQFYCRTDNANLQMRHIQFEKGNRATDWSPAPEDYVSGGRNILRGTLNYPDDRVWIKGGWYTSNGVYGTVTKNVKLTDPPLPNITTGVKITANEDCTVSTGRFVGIAQGGIPFRKQTIVQSVWIKGTAGDLIRLNPFWAHGEGTVPEDGWRNFTIPDNKWHKYITVNTPKYEHPVGDNPSNKENIFANGGYVYFHSDTEGNSIYVCGDKLEYGIYPTDWTPAPEDIDDSIDTAQSTADTALAQSVEYIKGTQTTTTNVWTGVSKDTSLKTGKTIAYYLPYPGNSTAATLNLTLEGGGTTGAKKVRWNNTDITTHYPQHSVITLTYDGTYWRTGAYNSDTMNRVRMQNVISAAEAITANHIICGTASGYRNIGADISFDLSYPLLRANTAIAKGQTDDTRDNNFLEINDVDASVNGTITSGAASKTLFLKGKVTGNTFKISASPFMTTVPPTSSDGYYYIPLGVMYSATNIYFRSSNRLYGYLDGAFQPLDTASVLRAQNAMHRATATYGTSSTAAGTAEKAVSCSNFVLFDGARIQVTFTNANTASAPTLNVNSTGAKAIYINKTVTSSTNLLLWTAGSKMEFVYDGTGWIAQNVPYALYGTCSTGASTAAKAVTCNEAVICKGTTISVNMTNTNTAANATMNVGSTLAKDIYANGAKLTTNSRFNWRANTTQKFVFDGQVWRMDDDSVKALATAYITEIDDDGIMVHPEDDDTSGWAISDAIQLFKNGISYIKLWIENNIPKIRIGKEDQGHIILDNDSVDIRNDDKVLASFGATSVIGDTNDWHQTIAANQITFAKGDNTITYISPDKLYTINAEVADAFYISNYSIRNASDGKLVIGLRR